ncbi:MAG: PIG-L deacetylase family protein [Terriglobales bacterium]
MNWRADRLQNWNQLSRQLQTTRPDSSLRILVLAAHPDDETIGASVLLSRFPQVFVAFLTDGAPRDTQFWSKGLCGSREAYAETRRQEACQALAYVGVCRQSVFWLGGVDQEAAFEIGSLAGELAKLIAEMRPEIVITHAYEGGHPDHDSAAVIARIAISSFGILPLLMEMTSYHARDGRCETGEFLNSDPSFEVCFELSNEDRERKRRMMDAHASQRLVLESFPIDHERFRFAPEYNFSEPPHSGKLWYECMGWPMTAVRWCELATSALAGLQEHSCR